MLCLRTPHVDLDADEGQELWEGLDDRLVAPREVFGDQYCHVAGVGSP